MHIVGVVSGNSVVARSVPDAPGAPDGVVTTSGCGDGGLIVANSGASKGDARPLVVTDGRDASSVSMSRSPAVPAAWSTQETVGYRSDATGTVLVATDRRPGAASSDTAPLARWDPTARRWYRINLSMPRSPMVVVDEHARVFALQYRT